MKRLLMNVPSLDLLMEKNNTSLGTRSTTLAMALILRAMKTQPESRMHRPI